jgi:pentatricopeptide repeat protein
MLNACIRCKNIELAESLVEEMTSKNIEKNLYIYSTMINGYRKTKKIGKAIELYDYLVNKLKPDDSVKLNTVFFNSILDCCVDSNKYDKMNEIFTYMQEKSSEDKEFPQIDLITYSIVMKGYAKSDSIAKVNEIYSYIRTRKDFILDEVLYNTILDCYARHNDEENLVKVFKDMKTNCVKASLFTYGVLIKLYFNIGNCNKAFELFDELVKSETKPNAAIYQMLIKLQLKSNLIERAITMFKNMLVNNIKADNVIYELTIKACFENDHAKEGSEFMLGSIKEGIKLERTIYELFINSIKIYSCHFKHIKKYELLGNLLTTMQD